MINFVNSNSSKNSNFTNSLNDVNQSLNGFKFGVDGSGDYGYFKVGADSVTPFKSEATVKLLGGLGSYNLKTMGIKNYEKLTANNFIIEAVSFDGGGGAQHGGGGVRIWRSTFPKSYNANTGVFTCSQNQVVTAWVDSTPANYTPQTAHSASVRVWVAY